MAKRTNIGRVDAALIEAMADAVDAEKIDVQTMQQAIEVGGVFVVPEKGLASLNAQADIVAQAKKAGYSHDVAVNTLMQGRARAHERRTIIRGAVGSEAITAKPIRIKSDGKGAVQLINNAARNGNINRLRDTEAGAFLLRGTTEGNRIAAGLADLQKTYTPLEADHAANGKVEEDDFDWS